MNALLIHGLPGKSEYYDEHYPSGSNSHWLPWLSKQLIIRDISTVAIEMPDGYRPVYVVWKKELERYDITEHTILVGHSLGGGFLIRWLSEENVRVGKVVLVAPGLCKMAGECDYGEDFDDAFFDFNLDPNIIQKTAGLSLMVSKNDAPNILDTAKFVMSNIPGVKLIEFENKGHFTKKSLGTDAFPELLEEIIR